jgi:hypothetical protein
MRFISNDEIESEAASLWRAHAFQPGFDVERLIDDLGLGLIWETVEDPPDAIVLGQLSPGDRQVILNERHLPELEANAGRVRRFTLAHEIGHWQLHASAARSGTLELFVGGRTWCRSGSRDQPEVQAERFAAALLMPDDLIRPCLPDGPWYGWRPVYDLADQFLVSPTAMSIRLQHLYLMHLNDDGYPCSGPAESGGALELPW